MSLPSPSLYDLLTRASSPVPLPPAQAEALNPNAQWKAEEPSLFLPTYNPSCHSHGPIPAESAEGALSAPL